MKIPKQFVGFEFLRQITAISVLFLIHNPLSKDFMQAMPLKCSSVTRELHYSPSFQSLNSLWTLWHHKLMKGQWVLFANAPLSFVRLFSCPMMWSRSRIWTWLLWSSVTVHSCLHLSSVCPHMTNSPVILDPAVPSCSEEALDSSPPTYSPVPFSQSALSIYTCPFLLVPCQILYCAFQPSLPA